MEITWLGHSAILIKGSRTVYIDPFLSGNPAASTTPDKIKEADVIVVTHHHGDHAGSLAELAERARSRKILPDELADWG